MMHIAGIITGLLQTLVFLCALASQDQLVNMLLGEGFDFLVTVYIVSRLLAQRIPLETIWGS